MFHHRSVAFAGGSLNAPSSNSNLAHDENLMRRGNQLKPNSMGGGKTTPSVSKTPAAGSKSLRRRAFGDISNKKGSRGFGQDSSSAKQQQQPQKPSLLPSDSVLKPRSNNLLPRSARSVASSSRFAILPEEQPKQQKQKSNHPRSTTIAQVKPRPALKPKPVPDIELPAGRTWKQQLEYDLKDEDDLASTCSLDSILEDMKNYHSTSQERWEEERRLQWERQQQQAESDDRELKEQMNALLLDQEQKEAKEDLDRLYDVIDCLDIFSDNDEGLLDANGNEEWSQVSEASDLLFPL